MKGKAMNTGRGRAHRRGVGGLTADAARCSAPGFAESSRQRVVVGDDGKTSEATKALFVIAEVARQNFEGPAERQAAVEIAFCALTGKRQPSAADRKRIARELAK